MSEREEEEEKRRVSLRDVTEVSLSLSPKHLLLPRTSHPHLSPLLLPLSHIMFCRKFLLTLALTALVCGTAVRAQVRRFFGAREEGRKQREKRAIRAEHSKRRQLK